MSTPTTPAPEPRRVGAKEEEVSTAQRRGIQRLLAALGASPRKPGRKAESTAVPVPSTAAFRFTPKEGRYAQEGEITRGGMGAIHRVQDQDLARPSAMKILLPDLLCDPTSAIRFVTEARITALLEHPNIVPVHDIGTTKAEGLFFIMKLVAGEPLSDILAKVARNDSEYRERYDRHQLLIIFRKICDAVAFAHSRGVIHRDIKPHNTMVGKYGEVLLMDWGLAKLIGGAGEESAHVRPPRVPRGRDATTTMGVIKGTPCYMAPEQACGRGGEVDEQTDIFLLGGTLYHILTLVPPYTGSDTDEILLKAAQGIIVPPNDRSPAQQVPEELCRIVARATAVRKAERYRKVEELMADLDAWMAGRTLYQRRVFKPGEYLMRTGEIGSEGYLILRGAVEVLHEQAGKRILLTTLGPGDTVGEMAIITNEARSATVIARQETEVQVITRQLMVDEMKKMAPWMDNVVTALAQRLQAANDHIHPLLMGDCVPHIVAQLALLVRLGGQQAETSSSAPLLPCETPGRIASILALPAGRVETVMELLVRERLLGPAEAGAWAVTDRDRLQEFADHCERRLAIEGGGLSALDLAPPRTQPREDFAALHRRLATGLATAPGKRGG